MAVLGIDHLPGAGWALVRGESRVPLELFLRRSFPSPADGSTVDDKVGSPPLRAPWEARAHLSRMTDREHADAVLEHVAVLAFLYYPGIQVDDPTYRLAEDIEWCVARLGDVSDTEQERMRALIARAIIDPTATREELFTALGELNGVHAVGHHA